MAKTVVKRLAKVMLLSYAVTGLLLLLLAFLLYKLELGEAAVNGGIIAVYIVSCFLAGFVMGKLCGTRKFLWGMAAGCVYYGILLLVSFGMRETGTAAAGNLATSAVICIASGMLGGMLS